MSIVLKKPKVSMRALWSAATVGLLAACSGSSAPDTASSSPLQAPPDAPGVTNTVPATPSAGQSRAGQVYNVSIRVPATGDTMVFTVFEPATVTGGQRYPLVLHSHGFSASRQTSLSSNPITSALSPGSSDIPTLVAQGYGVISIDERGHGESSGTIRVMDPDFEGRDLIAVLDWAEVRLNWLARGRSADGRDPDNLVVGAIGGSYGGMFQFLLNNIDPRRRLDALVPEIAPNDLTYSLFPNGTIKAGWDSALFLLGNTAGSGLDRGHFDPYIQRLFTTDLLTNQIAPDHLDFFRYHSNAYFCNGQRVATNGGPGTTPGFAPTPPPRVNALFWQGFRDTLFNFNEGFANYQCYRQAGGDVRLLTYQFGHNAIPLIPDPGALLHQPLGDSLRTQCGLVRKSDATIAFFNEYLKGQRGATNAVVPNRVCLSLSGTDAVQVDTVARGTGGTPITIPDTRVITGLIDVPVIAPLGITADAAGTVLGGIPHLRVTVTDTLPVPVLDSDPIVFVGVGHRRAAGPLRSWDLVDNQVTPLRGYGVHDVDLIGIAERLLPGDELALLFYGGHDQYHVTGSLNVASPTITTVQITGQVWMPLLGPLANSGQ